MGIISLATTTCSHGSSVAEIVDIVCFWGVGGDVEDDIEKPIFIHQPRARNCYKET